MRKIFSTLMVAAALFIFAACSGSSSYNPSTCKSLSEKIQNHEELSEGDMNTMIDQMGALLKDLQEKEDALKDDKEKQKEFLQSEEGKDMMTYLLGFAMYLQVNENKLTPDNVKKLEEIKAQFEKLEQ